MMKYFKNLNIAQINNAGIKCISGRYKEPCSIIFVLELWKFAYNHFMQEYACVVLNNVNAALRNQLAYSRDKFVIKMTCPLFFQRQIRHACYV